MLNAPRLASLLVLAGMAVPAMADNIAGIESQPTGTLVTLDSNPVVTAVGSQPGSLDGFTYTRYSIITQDTTGSLTLFGALPGAYVPAVGDTLSAAGTFGPFNQIPEIGSMTALANTGVAAVPAPLAITLAQLQVPPTNAILGYYVSLNNVLINQQNAGNPVPGNFPVHANGTYTITDSLGLNPVTMFQWASSYSSAGALGGTAVPNGLVNMTGIIDVFGTGANAITEFVPFTITPAPTSAGLLGIAALSFARRRRSVR